MPMRSLDYFRLPICLGITKLVGRYMYRLDRQSAVHTCPSMGPETGTDRLLPVSKIRLLRGGLQAELRTR